MDEMKMLRDHRDAQPGPTPDVVARARARLTDQARLRTRVPGGRRTRSRGRRYAWVAAAVAGAAAVAVLAPAALRGKQADRAYAAERLPNGTIKVTLREFVDSAGLQRRLNALGVHAVVDYLPPGLRCTDGRAAIDTSVNPQPEIVHPSESEALTFYVHAEHMRSGQTLLWTMTYGKNALDRHPPYAVSILSYLVRGPVKPCNPVPLYLARHRNPPRVQPAPTGD
jgi:hypothetical protein